MNRLRSLREDRDLRQIDVANATGIDQKTLSNYETGKTNPDSYSVITLARFFGVTTDYLLGESDKSYFNKADLIKHLDFIESEIKSLKKQIEKM